MTLSWTMCFEFFQFMIPGICQHWDGVNRVLVRKALHNKYNFAYNSTSPRAGYVFGVYSLSSTLLRPTCPAAPL